MAIKSAKKRMLNLSVVYCTFQTAVLWWPPFRTRTWCRGSPGASSPFIWPTHAWPRPLEHSPAYHQYWRLEDLTGLLAWWIWCVVGHTRNTVRHLSLSYISVFINSGSKIEGNNYKYQIEILVLFNLEKFLKYQL